MVFALTTAEALQATLMRSRLANAVPRRPNEAKAVHAAGNLAKLMRCCARCRPR
jgi:hypothetical protein